MIELQTGSRVKRNYGSDARVGTIMEINYGCAKIKWDEPTINFVTGAKQYHSTINLKKLIDINAPVEKEKAEEKINSQPDFGLFAQK